MLNFIRKTLIVIAVNHPSKGQRKSFSARKSMWANKGEDVQAQPKNPTRSKII
jgi:hypothetical protein